MSACVRSILVGVLGIGLSACGGGGGRDGTTSGGAETASIQLQLSTVGPSGNTYRLGPATFDIFDGDESSAVEATGDEPVLNVPVDPGNYDVTLRDDWVLQLRQGQGVSDRQGSSLRVGQCRHQSCGHEVSGFLGNPVHSRGGP